MSSDNNQGGQSAVGLNQNIDSIENQTQSTANLAAQAINGQVICDACLGAGVTEGQQLAQNGPFTVTPRGLGVVEVPDPNPLDPTRLNGPISPAEQQQIANALSMIVNQNPYPLNPHAYYNFPSPDIGAVLPPSAQGYITYDVPGPDPGRGPTRLIIENGTGTTYYTNTHYNSFYPVMLLPPPP